MKNLFPKNDENQKDEPSELDGCLGYCLFYFVY